MVRFAPWNPDMKMSEDDYKADVTAKSQAWSRGDRNWRDDPKTGRGAAGFLNERGIKPDDKVGLTRAMIEYDRSNRKSDVVTRPTRDLNTPKEPEYGLWQDAKLPDDRAWSGGSRDFDERSGTYRPGHRDDDYKFTQTNKGRSRERQRPEPNRDWWQ